MHRLGGRRYSTLIATAARFRHTSEPEGLLRHIGAISELAVMGYPPRKRGIATLTSDILGERWLPGVPRASVSRCRLTTEGGYQYPDVVRFQIEEQELASYRRAADFLNSANVDVVSLQHEFGIFGVRPAATCWHCFAI